MGNKLKEVTYLTVKDLKRYEIVLPSRYSKTFESVASKLSVDFDQEEMILKDLNEEFDHVDKIVRKTNENLSYLHESTSNAQKAIKDKDDEALKAINSELEKMQKKIDFLQKELFSDPLTGAYNRKWFADHFLSDAQFQNDGFMAFLDLNKFKIINDTYGHIVGDQVLKYLVKFLQKELDYPGVDIVRYAGDEFIVLFTKGKSPVINVDETMKTTQKKLSRQKLKSAKIDSLQFSFSYGLTTFKSGDSIDDVLETVDELMYQNKEANR